MLNSDLQLTAPLPSGHSMGCGVLLGNQGLMTVRSFKVRKKFLDALEKGYSVSRACRDADIDVRTAKQWRKEDADFAADWDEAIESGTDALEDKARDRAMKESDSLMTTLLKARRPEKYRERSSVEHSGQLDLSSARSKLEARLAALAQRRGQAGAASESE